MEIRSVATGRPTGQLSKVIGLYQILFRRALGHFFPDAVLEPIGDRSVIRLNGNGGPAGPNFRIADEPDGGMGLEIEWFRSIYLFQPGPPISFSAAELRLVQAVAEALDQRFRSLYDLEAAHRADQYQYTIEDLAVARYLGTPAPERIPEALEALRIAALSTYENRRVSTGVLLLGTESDPSEPRRANPPGAPRYNVHLAALQSVHRLCDGLRTVFLVNHNGDLAWPVDLARWAREVQGSARLPAPCSHPY